MASSRAIPRWMWATLVVPLLFVAWSVSLFGTVNRHRDDVHGGVALLAQLIELESALHGLEGPLLSKDGKTSEVEWQQQALAARGALAALLERKLEQRITDHLQQVGRHLTSAEALISSTWALEAHPRSEKELAALIDLRDAISEVRTAIADLRSGLWARSRDLDSKWKQLYPLVLVSSALAVVAAVLLLLRQREIAERRRTEEQTARQNEILQSILRNVGEGVVVADEHARFILFNPTAEKIVGLGVTDSRPDQWSQVYGLFRPDGKTPIPAEELPLARAVQGHPSHEVPIFVRNENVPDGVFISVTATPLRDSQGVLRGGVAVFRDVTERREAEAARWARELASHLQAAREDERRSLAREIHDELGQALTGLKLEASFLLRRIERPELRDRLERMGLLIDETIVAVRRIAAQLRPQILDELGLVEAIRWQAGEFRERTGIPCELDLPESHTGCDQEGATAMFRILQESLTNVARHAGASRVWVRIVCSPRQLVLEVWDDGRGISREAASSPRSFGLIGMRERARMLGGEVTVGDAPAGGTLVHAEIPLGREVRA